MSNLDLSITRDFAAEEEAEKTWEGWRDISLANVTSWLRSRDSLPHRVDVLAKCWFAAEDKFEYRRFVNVYPKYDSNGSGKWYWVDLEDGWRVVAYRELPPIPDKWPIR